MKYVAKLALQAFADIDKAESACSITIEHAPFYISSTSFGMKLGAYYEAKVLLLPFMKSLMAAMTYPRTRGTGSESPAISSGVMRSL